MSFLSKLLGLDKAVEPLNLKSHYDPDVPWFMPIGASDGLPRTNFDYASQVGDGLGSSVLMSPIKWVQRTFPEAPLVITRLDDETPILDHALVTKIRKPNDFYSGNDLWTGTLYSYIFDGNAYWRLVRNESTRAITEIWYVPHWMLTPRGDKGTFIDHYDFRPHAGTLMKLPVEDVVHFRNGINPRNLRLGMSLVMSEFREIFGDDEAANFTASLLRNMGVPGLMVTPDAAAGPMRGDMDAIKSYLQQQFTRDKRGQPLAFRSPMKIQQFGFDPNSMDLSALRNIAEERICAALSIPAAVVGFGTGLEQTKVGATMTALIGLAWNGCIIPMQKDFAAKIENQLIPEYEPMPMRFNAKFDTSDVAALAPNRREDAETVNIGVQGGWIKVSEARAVVGLESGAEDDIYLRSIGTIEQSAGEKGLASMVKDNHTALEESVGTRPTVRATAQQSRLIRTLERQAPELDQVFEKELLQFFEKMGLRIVEIFEELTAGKRRDVEAAEAAAIEGVVTRIMNNLDLEDLRESMEDLGKMHFERVATATHETIFGEFSATLQINPTPSVAELNILRKEGGRRLGLVDLNKSTRQNLFNVIAEARATGRGVPEAERAIRPIIEGLKNSPGGRWRTVKTRSRIIARTETLHAQRKSTLEAYNEAANVSEVLIFDNRGGFGDSVCADLDQTPVTLDEAHQLMLDEHPNGTRNWAPIVT